MLAKEPAEKAPEFEGSDASDRRISLADYRGKLNIVLVLNRGFG